MFLQKFSDSVRNFDSLVQAREGIGVCREQTVAVLDGNVAMMNVPSFVDTFKAYKDFLIQQLQIVINAAKHVVVVFDEPENITAAKREEQNARDARRTSKVPICSDDLVLCPVNDEYDRAALEDPGLNTKLLMDHRKARARFFDAVCVDVSNYFISNMPSVEGWSLTFDGIDGRGVERSRTASRVPGIVASHAVWEEILARENPIGEGDLKLPDVCARVTKWRRANEREPKEVCNIVLFLLQTIDTDSFAIEAIAQSRREQEAHTHNDGDASETVLLCLREPARKRKADDGGSNNQSTKAYFRCIDIESFHTAILRHLFLSPLTVSFERRRAAILLFAVSVALCGCDFVEVAGLRCDLMLSAVRDVVRSSPEILTEAFAPYSGDAKTTVLFANALTTVVDAYVADLTHESAAHMQRRRSQASNIQEMQLLRGAWLAGYWSGTEFKDCHEWGFAHTAKD